MEEIEAEMQTLPEERSRKRSHHCCGMDEFVSAVGSLKRKVFICNCMKTERFVDFRMASLKACISGMG